MMERRSGLVPVHQEDGGIQFSYEVVPFVLGRTAPATAPAIIDAEKYGDRSGGAGGREDSDAAPDFLGFDDINEAAPTDSAAATARDSAALLDDYVSLGILDAGDGAAAPANTAAAPPPELPHAPWLPAVRGISSPLLRLHQEIVEFGRFVLPTAAEVASRQAAVDRIQATVQSIWPDATLEVFGSFATGLFLPTSDIDAVILNSGCTDITSGLKALANALTRRKIASKMQVIAKARVPIVKFEETEGGFAFDVSFDVANGPDAAANVRSLMEQLPPMRPLVTVIKVFLQQRELNEVYMGGIGSYALLVMVAAFLLTHPSRRRPQQPQQRGGKKNGKGSMAGSLETNLGTLLVDFFRLYGRALSNTYVGVSCRRGGGFFAKKSRGFFQEDRAYLLSVEDPNDPTNDLGMNSYNASRVRAAFDHACSCLTGPSLPTESLLQRIIRMDPTLFLREPVPMPGDNTEEEEEGEAKPEKKKKKKGAKEGQRSEEAEEGEQREREAKEGSGGRGGAGGRKKKKRRRERSLSDGEDGEGGRRGGERGAHFRRSLSASRGEGRRGSGKRGGKQRHGGKRERDEENTHHSPKRSKKNR